LKASELTIKAARTVGERIICVMCAAGAAEKNRFLWRGECIRPLLWAVGKAENDNTVAEVNIPILVTLMPKFQTPTGAFIRGLKLRKPSLIADELDFIYRAHWATRQQYRDGVTPIGALNPDVVMERHYAMNWLTSDESWDEVSTDT
jgi:hypothetical protein